MLRDTRRSSKPEYRARYPDARPAFAQRSAERLPILSLKSVGSPPVLEPSFGLAGHFSRLEYGCQPGLHPDFESGRRFNSAFVSRAFRVASVAAMQPRLRVGAEHGAAPWRPTIFRSDLGAPWLSATDAKPFSISPMWLSSPDSESG